ncbi:MAG: hypothetical protein CMJ18_13420 [Phycisphaeraceae bacterium]|nr:hypothetical protein [Phycisphaeraceae bacterium]
MGWFIKAPTGGADRRRGRAAPDDDGEASKGRLRILIVAGTVLAIVVGCHFLERFLWRHAHERHGPVMEVRLDRERTDLDRYAAQQIRRTVVHRISDVEASADLLPSILAALQDHPWVERVDSVRRTRHGIVIDAEYRRPVAVVAHRDGYSRVDRVGVLLPGLFVASQIPDLGLPVISGVAAPHEGDGRPWPGRDLEGGLRVVDVIRDQPFADQVLEIDVSATDDRDRPRLALYTREGMIRWGLPPGEGRPIEPDTDTKLRRLAQVQRKWDSIDAGGKIVDIYGPAIFVRPWPDDGPGVQTGYDD